MKGFTRLLVSALICMMLPGPCTAIDLVREGKPVSTIVIPSSPIEVETLAAKELQYHIKASTDAELAITPEDKAPMAGGHIYLGHCSRTMTVKADPSTLPGNGYVLKTVGDDLYIAGKDSAGDPMKMRTHAGTLFAVYDILENNLGVRWLWPGKLGEVIPSRQSATLPDLNASVKPLLYFKDWRTGLSVQFAGGDIAGFASPEKYEKFAHDEAQWLRRQRFGWSERPAYGHSYTNYWERFGKTHPEYFSMMPDGTRGLDPRSGGNPKYVHMCVSQPGLLKQKLQDWVDDGMPPYINICENDGWAGCTCLRCMSWDVPSPDEHIAFDKRLEEAKKVYSGEDGDASLWMLKLGSLSDRYARYANYVSHEASRLKPDVKVTMYAYDNYAKPPVSTELNKNILVGLVPEAMGFPYNKKESDTFRKYWEGWAKTGCTLFLRPNYTLQGHDFPVFYARTLGEDLKFAMNHSMVGADFDSLTGQYAAQGPTLYMIAKILNHPDASVERTIDEFCSAFGPAKGEVKDYFDYWAKVYGRYDKSQYDKLIAANRKYGAGFESFFGIAPEIYTPEIMDKGFALLRKAKSAAAGDKLSMQRVEWIEKGLTHAKLTAAVQRAYKHKVSTGDDKEFTKAYQALRKFRMENSDDCVSNFGAMAGIENHKWIKH